MVRNTIIILALVGFCTMVFAQDTVRPLPAGVRLGLPQASGGSPLQTPPPVQASVVKPLAAAKLAETFKAAGDALMAGSPPPIANAGGTFALTPGQAIVPNRGAFFFNAPRWVSNQTSGMSSAHYAGTADLNTSHVTIQMMGLANKIVVVDCHVSNNDGPSKADDGAQYLFRVFTLSGGAITSDLGGQTTADDGHVLFAFRPNAEPYFLRFNRIAGYWSLNRCDVIPAQ
jgi:hypothetical protein